MGSIKTQPVWGGQLPADLWVDVLSFLPHADLGRALCTCRAMASISSLAWRAACYRRWPAWAPIADEADTKWRRIYELLLLRDSEKAAVTEVAAVTNRQSVVNERHRAILAEWLCEVSLDWNLESTIVFDAIKYLDRYLSIENVEQLNRFQLVGLGCLRAAIQDRGNRPAHCDTKENLLEAKNYSYISDNIYKPEEVEEMTEAVSSAIPLALKKAANSKMFLRSLWFRATNRNVAASDEMHIYILASFLVKLSLLDLSCSGFAPSLISAAAMSLALSYFGKPAWPTALRSFVAYTHADLESARMQLANAQAHSIATNLRSAWSRIYAENRNSISEQYSEQWRRAHQLFAFPSTALLDIIRNPAMSSLEEKERSHFRPKRLENILSLASQVDAKTVNQHLSDNGEDLASVDASSQSTQTAMEL